MNLLRKYSNNIFLRQKSNNIPEHSTNNICDLYTKALLQGWLSDHDFSLLIQNCLISKNGYVIDTGNNENVNAAVALLLKEKIKKHPLLWKLFFMVA